MDLKSGLTFWAKKNRPSARFPRLTSDVTCDVAIVGGGITGALVAHELVRRGLDVVVLDKRVPGTGSTSASTALLLYETDASLAELTRRHGRAAAVRAYVLGRRAIGEIGGIVRKLRLDCGFARRKSLYLASDERGLAAIRLEHSLRRRAGMRVEFLSRPRLWKKMGLNFPGALYSGGAAQVDAMRLVQRLLKYHVARRALKVFQHTPIKRIKAAAERVGLRTATGHVVTAKYVVIAAGYEAAPFLEQGLVRLDSSYVVASEPVPPRLLWRDRCLIWETARPYLYLRTTADGRIMIGGEDEPLADPRRRDAKLARKARQLVEKFRLLFPHVPFKPAFAWSGTFGDSRDGLPYIGPHRAGPRVLYALGYGGNGITFSQVAAKIIGRFCVGRSSPDAKLFRFGREKRARQRSRGTRTKLRS